METCTPTIWELEVKLRTPVAPPRVQHTCHHRFSLQLPFPATNNHALAQRWIQTQRQNDRCRQARRRGSGLHGEEVGCQTVHALVAALLSSDYQALNSCLRPRPNPLTTWSSLLHKQPRPCFPLHPSLVSFIRPQRLISLKTWSQRLHRIILVLSSSTMPISQYPRSDSQTSCPT